MLTRPRFLQIQTVLFLTIFFLVSLHSTARSQQTAPQQRMNIERVVAQLEPEIQRTLIEGKIPSCTIALISGEEIIWTGAYGYSNLWARTPAVPNTV